MTETICPAKPKMMRNRNEKEDKEDKEEKFIKGIKAAEWDHFLSSFYRNSLIVLATVLPGRYYYHTRIWNQKVELVFPNAHSWHMAEAGNKA